MDLAPALADGWGLDAASLSYLRRGAGSDHWVARTGAGESYFVVVDDLGAKPWISKDRGSTLEGLRTAYEAARALSVSDGLEFVVAPLPSTSGAVCVPLSDQHAVVVFPFVAGQAGTWGETLGAGDRLELAVLLARLHQAGAGRVTLRRPSHDLAERAALVTALDAVDSTWDDGPFGEPARHALAPRASGVRETLARFDELAAHLDATDPPRVVTHGEPHPGNLLRTGQGLRLVDWDTVALAEPERDLLMLDARAWEAYADRTHRRVDGDAIAFYQLLWILADVAWLADTFRRSHEQSAWGARKCDELVAMLDRGVATPWATMAP